MSVEAPEKDNLHGEAQQKPIFGPGSDDAKPVGDSSPPVPGRNLPTYEKNNSALSPTQLANKENSNGPVSSNSSEGKKLGLNIINDQVGKGYNPTQTKGKLNVDSLKNAGKRFIKRRASIGIIACLLSFVGVTMSGISLEAIKAVHIAEAFGLADRTQDNTNDARMTGLYRFMRSGNINETRVGFIGSYQHRKIAAKLEAQGIKIDSATGGRFGDVTLDLNKTPGLQDLSLEQKLEKISNTYGVPKDKLIQRGRGDVTIPKEFMGDKASKSLNSTLGLSDMGKISRSMAYRNFSKWFGEFSIFHPMKKTQEALSTKVDEKIAKRREKIKEKQASITAPSPEQKSKISSFKDKVAESKGMKVGGASIAVLGNVCLVKDVAKGISYVQYASAVLPAMKAVAYMEGVGSQVKSGQDITARAVGDEISTTINSLGQDITSAKAFNALTGKVEGVDMDDGLKSAFSPENKAASVAEAMDSVPGIDAACSPLGMAVQIGASLALLAASGGAGNFIVKTGTSIGSSIVIGQVLGFVEKMFAKDLSKAVLEGGPLGGNLLAHGAMALAGSSAMSFGGVAFSQVASDEIRSQRIADYHNEFSQKNFIARTFDVYDQRSVIASIIDRTPNNSSQAISNIASLIDFKSILNTFSFLSPKASAVTRSYDWSMPEYGFSKAILNDEKYQDPYENASKVASYIEGSDYIKRAKTCFGANIAKDSDGAWDVTTDSEVVPSTADYHEAKCANQSDENWTRVRLFILDTKNMNALFCFQEDESDAEVQKACQSAGVASSTTTTSTTTDQSTAGATIDLDQISQPSENINCAEGTKDLGLQDGYTGGNPVKIRICAIPGFISTGDESQDKFGVSGSGGDVIVNSRVSGAVLAMFNQAKKDGITLTAISSFRTMAHQQSLCPCDGVSVARPGYSNHQLGIAIDFGGGLPSTPGPIAGNEFWGWLSNNAEKFGYKNYPAEAWHWSPTGH